MNWIELYSKYKKIIWASIGCLVLLVIIAFTVTSVQNWRFKSSIEKQKEQVNALTQQSNTIKDTIANLEEQKKEIDAKAEQANANLQILEDETNTAKDETNKSLDNLNRVNSINFNGSGYNAARDAQCRAFPNSPDCVR